jgi:hypothetical protein
VRSWTVGVAVVAAGLALAGASRGAQGADPPRVVIEGASVGSFSALVRWQVDQAARVVIEYGIGAETQVWSKESRMTAAGSGTTRLSTLEPGTAYRFRVLALPLTGGVPGVSEGGITTQPMPTVIRGRTIANALVVNGQRFFPRMVFKQCPYAFNTSLAAGINLFMGTQCATIPAHLGRLAGRALSVTAIETRNVYGPGLVGWHHLDEADEHVDRPTAIPLVPSSAQSGRVTFLTLTNHFYSKSSQFPHAGPGFYPGLVARAEMVGFDLYPLQNWCRKDAMHAVYDAQVELAALASGKPTFQWIEAAPMNQCFGLDPSPPVVRAETWLAVAGGARGIGYFPDQWRSDVRAEMTRINRDLAGLAPALLDRGAKAPVAEPSPVRAGVRYHNGAVYVIAVNPTFARTSARITVPGLAATAVRRFGDGRRLATRAGVLRDSFRGLEVKIYIAPPPGFG